MIVGAALWPRVCKIAAFDRELQKQRTLQQVIEVIVGASKSVSPSMRLVGFRRSE
jgi:hypothetical protein